MKKLAFAFAITVAAFATPALAIDFSKTIDQLDGTPMRDTDQSLMTLEKVATTALLLSYQDEQTLDGVEKNKRFWLAKRINTTRKDPELSPEDITLIKKLIAKAYNPLVTGQSWSMLDPTTVPK